MRAYHLALPGFLAAQAALLGARGAQAGCPNPDSSYVTVTFSRTFTGAYQHGLPYDVVTVDPSGNGETFAGTGITIRVYLRNNGGTPLVGIPREEIQLFNSNLCICPGGNIADHASDANGETTFSGSLSAGGCAPNLIVFATCNVIATIPVKINGPDATPASPCAVDASDLSALVARRGAQVGQGNYSICFDFNEDGSIDASEVALFASALGGQCPSPP